MKHIMMLMFWRFFNINSVLTDSFWCISPKSKKSWATSITGIATASAFSFAVRGLFTKSVVIFLSLELEQDAKTITDNIRVKNVFIFNFKTK